MEGVPGVKNTVGGGAGEGQTPESESAAALVAGRQPTASLGEHEQVDGEHMEDEEHGTQLETTVGAPEAGTGSHSGGRGGIGHGGAGDPPQDEADGVPVFVGEGTATELEGPGAESATLNERGDEMIGEGNLLYVGPPANVATVDGQAALSSLHEHDSVSTAGVRTASRSSGTARSHSSRSRDTSGGNTRESTTREGTTEPSTSGSTSGSAANGTRAAAPNHARRRDAPNRPDIGAPPRGQPGLRNRRTAQRAVEPAAEPAPAAATERLPLITKEMLAPSVESFFPWLEQAYGDHRLEYEFWAYADDMFRDRRLRLLLLVHCYLLIVLFLFCVSTWSDFKLLGKAMTLVVIGGTIAQSLGVRQRWSGYYGGGRGMVLPVLATNLGNGLCEPIFCVIGWTQRKGICDSYKQDMMVWPLLWFAFSGCTCSILLRIRWSYNALLHSGCALVWLACTYHLLEDGDKFVASMHIVFLTIGVVSFTAYEVEASHRQNFEASRGLHSTS